jgi:hypothetical protein
VAEEMSGIFDDFSLPRMKRLVEEGLYHDEVKR